MTATIERTALNLQTPPPPFLARVFCPAGPPILESLSCAGAQVVAVPGRFGVSYLVVGPEGLAVVDVGSVLDVPFLGEVARHLGKPIKLLIPSHIHFDHVLGMNAAAHAFAAPVAPSRVAADHWAAGRKLRMPSMKNVGVFSVAWVWQGMPFLSPEDRRQVRRFTIFDGRVPFEGPLAEPLGEGDGVPGCPGWTVLVTPGHSDDAICLYHQQAGFLIAGDNIRNYQGGEYNPLLTDPQAYRASVARLKKLFVQAAFPGHGPVLMGRGLMSQLQAEKNIGQ